MKEARDTLIKILRREGFVLTQSDISDFHIINEHEGELNKVYIIGFGQKKVVAKRLNIRGYWNNLEREYYILRNLKNFEVGSPKVYGYEKDSPVGEIVLMEFIEGKQLNKISYNSHLANISKVMRHLHNQKIFPNSFNEKSGIKTYADHFEIVEELRTYTARRMTELEQLEIPERLFGLMYYYTNTANKEIGKRKDFFKGNNFVFCHKDFKVSNMILTSDNSIKLIDWEHSNFSDPAFEAAIFMKNSSLSKEERKIFTENYKPMDDYFIRRVISYMPFFLVPSLIWHVDRIHNSRNKFSKEKIGFYKKGLENVLAQLSRIY